VIAREFHAEPASIPFIDLRAQFAVLADEILPLLHEVLSTGSYVLGPHVTLFEKAFAEYVGARHCVAVNSGTSALHLALLGAGVGAGDEVITVPMTFVATCWAVTYVGARPVFVDIDPTTYTMSVEQIRNRITRRTRALLPVHLYGQPADMAPLLEIGEELGIPVIEDAAQAHGARYQEQQAGSMGLCGCFSFYPGKNLGAAGEGGAVVTNDDVIAARLRALRDHGQWERHVHDEIGFNYRMDAIQGAVLGVKLRHLERWTEARRRFAARYQERLCTLPLKLPTQAQDRRHVWHLYVILHPDRDRLRKVLEIERIATGMHYPIPIHLQKAYEHLGHRPGEFPVAERFAQQCLSLPLFPEMTDAQQDRVVEVLVSALRWS